MALDIHTNPARRQGVLERAWAAYDGAMPPPLNLGRNGANDNVRVNLARHLVDTYTGHALGRGVGIQSDSSETGRTDVEALIDAYWPAEKRNAQLIRLGVEGGVTGSCFLRVIPGRVIVLPTDAVTVVADPMDAERMLRYVIEHDLPDLPNGASETLRQTHAAQSDGTWIITDQVIRNGGRPTTVGVTPWPFPLPQVVHCQFLPSVWIYGEPLVTSAILDLIAAIERTLSNAAKATRLNASPLPYTYGLNREAQSAYDQRDSGSTVHLNDRELQSLGVVEISGGSIEQMLALADKLLAQFWGITGLPDPESADGKISDTSGAALELRLATMIQRVEQIRRNVGGLVLGACDRLLMFGGHEPATLTLEWPPILPDDPDARIARAKALAELGASRETVLLTAGLDPNVEAARLEAERPADIGGLLASLNVATGDQAAP